MKLKNEIVFFIIAVGLIGGCSYVLQYVPDPKKIIMFTIMGIGVIISLIFAIKSKIDADIKNIKNCDSCKKNQANYKQNEYTFLCRDCWLEIANNLSKSWRNKEDLWKGKTMFDYLDHLWIYDESKIIS